MRCPVCRAENTEAGNCRRCRADLALLWSLESRRQKVLKAGWQAASCFDGEAVVQQAAQAHALRHGQDSRHLLALGHLFCGDFPAAQRCLLPGKKHA